MAPVTQHISIATLGHSTAKSNTLTSSLNRSTLKNIPPRESFKSYMFHEQLYKTSALELACDIHHHHPCCDQCHACQLGWGWNLPVDEHAD